MSASDPIRDQPLLDRRQLDRRSTRYLRSYSPVPGVIVNISHRGMCLETVAPMRPGVEYSFRVRHGSLLLAVKGIVRWTRLFSSLASSSGRSLELYRSGIEFSEPLEGETLESLESVESAAT